MKALPKVIIALCYFGLVSTCLAETVFPRGVRQEFELRRDSAAVQCSIMTMIINIPEPETVNYRISIIASNDKQHYFINFSVDVGEEIFVNGMPHGIKPVRLVAASANSDDYSTNGHFNIINESDGGITGTTIDETALVPLMIMLMKGNFQVTFQRFGDNTFRSYKINQILPQPEFEKFQACVANDVPH